VFGISGVYIHVTESQHSLEIQYVGLQLDDQFVCEIIFENICGLKDCLYGIDRHFHAGQEVSIPPNM